MVEKEIDVLNEAKNRQKFLRTEISLTRITENEFWKRSFTYSFIERLAFYKRKQGTRNKSLLRLAKQLLKTRQKSAIAPLKKIVKQFSGIGE